MKFRRSADAADTLGHDDARLQAAFMPAIYAERTDALDNEVHDFNHYQRIGLAENISPSVYFDPDFYVDQMEAAPTIPLLEHFLTVGATAGLNPHPLVDTATVVAQGELTDARDVLGFLASPAGRHVRLHPLFWSGFYLANNPSIADRVGHPLHHYLNVGHRRRRAPNPFFSHDYCAAILDDADDVDEPMLSHWLTFGVPADVVPTPLFDADHYRAQAALVGSDVDAYLHFLRVGLWQDLSPHPLIEPDWYRSQHGDVSADEPAVLHYLRLEHQRRHRPGPRFDPAAMQRIVVHDDHEYGGRILERYLAGGVTAVHVSPPLELSDALRAQLDDASALLPRATTHYQEALKTHAPIKQNFNTHDTRRTSALRILQATSASVGGVVAIVDSDDQWTIGEVERFGAEATRAGCSWHVVNVTRLLGDLEPSDDDRDAAVAQWLVQRATGLAIGIGSATWMSILKSRGLQLRQLMGTVVVASDGAEMGDLAHVIDHVDVLAVRDTDQGDNLLSEFALPVRHRERLLRLDDPVGGVGTLLDRVRSQRGDGPVVRYELR